MNCLSELSQKEKRKEKKIGIHGILNHGTRDLCRNLVTLDFVLEIWQIWAI
jgi:hypothetical protein